MDQAVLALSSLPALSAWAFVERLQRGMLLDLAGLDGDPRNVEAGILCYLNRIQFSSIESPGNSFERMGQSSGSCALSSFPKTSSGTGILDPHKVPSRLANHRIEDSRCNPFDNRPAIVNGLLKRIHSIGQDAALAQENGMRFHVRALLDAASASTLRETDSLSVADGSGALTT